MSKLIKLNFKEINSEDDFQNLLIHTFDLPYYYGKNEDAFWDCLTEYFGDETIEIQGLSSLCEPIKSSAKSYVDMLLEYENETNGVFKVTKVE